MNSLVTKTFCSAMILGLLSLAAACGSSGDTASGDPSTSDTSSGVGGGAASSSSVSASSSSSSSSSSAGGGQTSGTGGASPGGSHLLISELGVSPSGGEFIEIWNPTNVAVDLSDIYVSDNSSYTSMAAGQPWSPVTNNPGTDFLARFPPNTVLAPNQVFVIAGSPDFEMQFTRCPDFILATSAPSCSFGVIQPMVAPALGGIGDKAGNLLSNDREMVVLFRWDGKSSTVEDIDYLTWGTAFEDATRADKTTVPGYAPDTPRAQQKPASAAPQGMSIERCNADEPGEKTSGGNGITGHDETSEDFGAAFAKPSTPSPGLKNACLP